MNKSIFSKKFITVSVLVLFTVMCRLLTNKIHLWNFTPFVAICLFSGSRLKDWRTSFLIPICALIISDFMLGFPPAWYVYVTMIAITLIGFSLNENSTGVRLVSVTILSSLLFFLITNFVVFLQSGDEFASNLNGLSECYTLALPFYGNLIAGDLFYALVLFGGYELVKTQAPKFIQG